MNNLPKPDDVINGITLYGSAAGAKGEAVQEDRDGSEEEINMKILTCMK